MKYKAAVEIPTDRITVDENGCWIWNGTKHSDGYGLVTIRGEREYVHRAMYQLFIGPVNNKRELDHLCRNRVCCNPLHLEAVSSWENSIRGNHPLFTVHRERRCLKGHDLNIAENVYKRKDGKLRCRICSRAARRQRKQEAA